VALSAAGKSERPGQSLGVLCWGLLFGLGVAMSGVYTYIGPMAVQRFGASTFLVGLIFASSAAVGLVASPLAGLLTDRLGGRKGVIVADLLLGGLGLLGMGLSPSFPAMLVTTVCSSFGFGAMPLLLALLGDAERSADDAAPRSGASMLVRMGFALGYAVGAPLGGLAAQTVGYAALAIGVGILVFGLLAVALVLLPTIRPAVVREGSPAVRRGPPRPLLLFCLAGMLVIMGEQAKSLFLPLRLTQGLHLPPADVGLLAGAQAALELVMMPLAGRLADRLGLAPVLALTFFLPVPYLLGVSTATGLPLLVGLQLLEAAAVAGFDGLAYVEAQRLAPGQEGFGVNLYSAGWAAATLATGLLIGGGAQVVGIDAGLRLGALAALVGWGLLLTTHRLAGRRHAGGGDC
jgi:MFS transporter, SET family, sugar efflux transporter